MLLVFVGILVFCCFVDFGYGSILIQFMGMFVDGSVLFYLSDAVVYVDCGVRFIGLLMF